MSKRIYTAARLLFHWGLGTTLAAGLTMNEALVIGITSMLIGQITGILIKNPYTKK